MDGGEQENKGLLSREMVSEEFCNFPFLFYSVPTASFILFKLERLFLWLPIVKYSISILYNKLDSIISV